MVGVRVVSWGECVGLARGVWGRAPGARFWGVPRGGAAVAGMLAGLGADVVSEPQEATLAVDDIIDSGRTRDRVRREYGLETVALFDKLEKPFDEWLVFPWESGLERDAADTIVRLIQQIGDDPQRPGLQTTPEAVVSAWPTQFSGYTAAAPATLLTAVPLSTPSPDRLHSSRPAAPSAHSFVLVQRSISFSGTCERHLQPFAGQLDAACRLTAAQSGLELDRAALSALALSAARRLTTPAAVADLVAKALAADPHIESALVRATATRYCLPACGDLPFGAVQVVTAQEPPEPKWPLAAAL